MDPGRPDNERTNFELMVAGELYIADDPQIVALARRAMALTATYNATPFEDSEGRRRLLEELLGAFGSGSEIRAPFRCDYGSRINIGTGTFANFGLVALDVAEINIGDDVQMGPNVQLLTPTHPLDPALRRAKWESAEAIKIGDNVWLGGGTIVLPGVTIGADTVVGAGAVVSRNLPAGVIAVGTPARVIREL